jgi:tetratricopeptide (TPR) repeat protein
MDEAKTIRVFISSPGDVVEERRRAALVLGRLKRDFARFFKISPELWEYEPMIAAGTFQDVIIEPASTDIVVLILWSRLGTPLPPRTALRDYQGIDGRTPVTGTEWEFENALRAARERQARDEPATPNILVYKKDVDGVARGKTASKLDEAVRQMAALEQFWARYFESPDGHFTLAFNSFTSLDSFEQQLEAHLRALLHKRIETEDLKPATWPSNPFLGLMSFEFEHANIFFGRASAVQEITETLVRRAEAGRAFVLVAGASGCGKSSLVKAGVVPSLFEPGVVPGTQLWRRVAIRPSGAGAIADRLAAALIGDAALPELAALGVTPDRLSGELQRGEVLSLRYGLIEAARKAANVRTGGQSEADAGLAPMGCLLLVVDQLEELFTDTNLPPAEREWFVDLLIKLAASGFVWIIATMRSDFFAQMAAFPSLRDQCSGDGLYHLLPPRSEEIDQMIRLPADAAGIVFEVDARSGVGLDQELRSAASSNPYSLPLLEFTLDELYRRDILARRGRSLRIATYRDELKRLEGAIAARAEAVCKDFPLHVREQALPEILRSLVAIGEDDKPTARSAPLADLATESDRRSVLDSLINARLLVVHGQDQAPMVGVAHEALITEWPFYSELVKKHVNFLRARGRIAAQARLWQTENKDASRLLAPGLALEEGRSLLARRSEVGGDILDFVAASVDKAEKAERRRRRFLVAVASIATVTAVVFAGLAVYARRASVRAQSNFEAATTALSTLIESVPKNVEPVAPLQTVATLMDEASNAISRFPPTDGTSPKIRRYRAEISLALATIEFDLGRYPASRKLADEAQTMLSDVAASDSSDTETQYYLARSAHLFGATYYQLQDDLVLSQASYRKALSILGNLVHEHAADPDVWLWHLELAGVHRDFGDLLLDRIRAPSDAKSQFDLAMVELQDITQLNRGGSAVDYYFGWTINKLGDVLLRTGDKSDAITDFEHARDRIAALGSHLQENKEWQNHLSIIYNNIGLLLREDGNYDNAIDQFTRATDLIVALTSRDPDNTDLRSVLGWTYDNDGETLLRQAKAQSDNKADHLRRARDMLEKARAVRVTLADMKPQWQQDLTYTDASLAAVDGIELEIDGKNLEAGEAYGRAADLNQRVASASQRDDATERTIEFDEWAAATFSKAGAFDKARNQIQQAIDVAKNHHSIAGDAEMVSIAAKLEGLLQTGQK